MPIPLVCPACSRSYQVRDEFANRTIQCKSCGEAMTVPAAAPAVEAPRRGTPGAATAPADDWAKAFGTGATPRRQTASRARPPNGSSTSRSRRETSRDLDDEEGEAPTPSRSLRKQSRSPLLWVVVGLSILGSMGALGIGVWFGIQRRQANTATGPGGFPAGVPGNNSIPGQIPGQSFPPIDIRPPDFAPPDIPRPPFPVPDFPRPGGPRPPSGTPPQPNTGPVGPNLKEDPNRPGGFPATPGGVRQ
jgi:hypothetical protein